MDKIAERDHTRAAFDKDFKDYITEHAGPLSSWRGALVTKPDPCRIPMPAAAKAARDAIANPAEAKTLIRRFLRAPDTTATTHRLSAGRLDRRALPRIPAGAKDVFVRATMSDAVNVGVALTLDGSNSMDDGNRLAMARALALHFGEACEQAGAASMITAFHVVGQAARDAKRDGYLVTLKSFAERMTMAVRTRIACQYRANGGTHLAHAVMGSADALAARPEFTRRIVIALTDGACNSTPVGVHWACQYARARGVEVIGVLLEPEHLTELGKAFPNHHGATLGFAPEQAVMVPDAGALTKLALGALARALRGAPGFYC